MTTYTLIMKKYTFWRFCFLLGGMQSRVQYNRSGNLTLWSSYSQWNDELVYSLFTVFTTTMKNVSKLLIIEYWLIFLCNFYRTSSVWLRFSSLKTKTWFFRQELLTNQSLSRVPRVTSFTCKVSAIPYRKNTFHPSTPTTTKLLIF